MTRTLEGIISAEGRKLGIVVSRFNEQITERLLQGSLTAIRQCGGDLEKVEIVKVPGAFEIPLAAKYLAKSGRVEGIICLGAIIRGETAHFDYVASAAAGGVSQVMLETGIPISFGVLTTESIDQAVVRSGAKGGNKGWEAAVALFELISVIHTIKAER